MIGIVIGLIVLFILYRVMQSRNDTQAQNMGVETNEVKEAVVPVSDNVYVKAARDIGSGALESAKMAVDNTREVTSQVKRDAKVARLEALMADEELMEALKTKLKSE